MTLAGRRDNEQASYLDIVQAIETYGDPGNVKEDLTELFRRLAFNVMVGNRDDHLRNHGFLRARGGWRLAPAFDVNPSPEKFEHSIGISANGERSPDLRLVEVSADHFRLKRTQAEGIIAETKEVVSGWRTVAQRSGITRAQIEAVAPAFAF